MMERWSTEELFGAEQSGLVTPPAGGVAFELPGTSAQERQAMGERIKNPGEKTAYFNALNAAEKAPGKSVLQRWSTEELFPEELVSLTPGLTAPRKGVPEGTGWKRDTMAQDALKNTAVDVAKDVADLIAGFGGWMLRTPVQAGAAIVGGLASPFTGEGPTEVMNSAVAAGHKVDFISGAATKLVNSLREKGVQPTQIAAVMEHMGSALERGGEFVDKETGGRFPKAAFLTLAEAVQNKAVDVMHSGLKAAAGPKPDLVPPGPLPQPAPLRGEIRREPGRMPATPPEPVRAETPSSDLLRTPSQDTLTLEPKLKGLVPGTALPPEAGVLRAPEWKLEEGPYSAKQVEAQQAMHDYIFGEEAGGKPAPKAETSLELMPRGEIPDWQRQLGAGLEREARPEAQVPEWETDVQIRARQAEAEAARQAGLFSDAHLLELEPLKETPRRIPEQTPGTYPPSNMFLAGAEGSARNTLASAIPEPKAGGTNYEAIRKAMGGQADPKLLAGIAAAGGLAAYLATEDGAKHLDKLGLLSGLGLALTTKGDFASFLQKVTDHTAVTASLKAEKGLADFARSLKDKIQDRWERQQALTQEAIKAGVFRFVPGDIVQSNTTGKLYKIQDQHIREPIGKNLAGKSPEAMYRYEGLTAGEGEQGSCFASKAHEGFTLIDRPSMRIPRQEGGASTELLIKTGLAGGGAALGAALSDPEHKLHGTLLGAAGGLALSSMKKGGTLEAVPKGLDYALGQVSTRLGNVDPQLKLAARTFEMHTHQALEAARTAVTPFLKTLHDLPKEGKAKIDSALLSGKPGAIAAAIKGNPELVSGWRQVQTLLADFGEQHKKLGRFAEGISDYFPRLVKDLDGLKQAIGAKEGHRLELLLAKAEKESQLKNERPMTEVERSILIGRFMQADPGISHLPGYAKGRKINMTPELEKFYETPTDSLLRYVQAAAEDIQKAKFFGKDLVNKEVNGQKFIDINASVGKVVDSLLKRKEITPDQIDTVTSILRSRFVGGEKSPHVLLQDFRNLNNIALLGSFQSALTQLADTGMNVKHHGLLATAGAVAMQLSGKAKISAKDFGLANHVMEELGSGRPSGRALQMVFKAGFQAVDRFGKEINLNAGWLKNQKLAQTVAGQKTLAAKWGEAFGQDFPQLVKDLKAGERTDLTNQLLFSELSDAQPISKMEVPQAYLEHPNVRLLYQMKTYMLKQGDILRREAWQEMAKGNVGIGMKNLAIFAGVLMAAEVPGALIKEWMAGRPVDPLKIDHMENLLKTFGFNRYALEQMEKGNVLDSLRDKVVPPYRHWQEMAKGKTLLPYVPVVGRTLYERSAEGKQKRAIAEAKRQRAATEDPSDRARRLQRLRDRAAGRL